MQLQPDSMKSSMMNPPIEDLMSKVDSKFKLVTLASLRARNINSYFGQLGQGLGHMVPPQVSTVARKPLSIAFEEVAADKIVWAPPVEETETDAADLLPVGDVPAGDTAGDEPGDPA
jgi:DNA-directed RNA polymerase subunit omega